MYDFDTIAAVSTAIGTGGIGIIRISGLCAPELADKIFIGTKTVCEMASHTVQYGRIADPETKEIIDEVILVKMSAPATYTRENVIEINCHGSLISQRKILSLIYKNGVRPAEPGEFTKRAFLNGRIDLTQAEAVADLINAKTNKSHEAAMGQLSGKMADMLNEIIERILLVMARIEVTFDYPEHDDEMQENIIAGQEIAEILQCLKKAVETYNTGKIIKYGIKTAIIGKPNVGKSTLLNELSGFERAIVTDIPGTTRDVIEEEINIGGILLNLMDTAGIRDTEDIVEKIGINKARETINEAALIIYIISPEDTDPIDAELMQTVKGRKSIIIINKEDLTDEANLNGIINNIKSICGDLKIITTSFIKNKGIEEIKETIEEMFLEGNIFQNTEEIIITTERHINLMNLCIKSLKNTLDALDEKLPLDVISIDLKNAAEHLGEITGRNISEDMVDKIFSSFCLGK